MSKQLYGNIIVNQFVLDFLGKKVLSSGPFDYYIYQTIENETISLNELRSFTIYIFDKQSETKIKVNEINYFLEQGDCLQAENCAVDLTTFGGTATLLIAGTTQPHPSLEGLFLTKYADIYKVEKPWGYELWINGQHPCYALKKISIKAGTKTSLQYHNFKQETNVLFQGLANLHYKKNILVENDCVSASDISTILLKPISAMYVVPKTLHRVEAITDIVTFETSTPHLDDVIRVQDDSKRPDGRLIEEHINT